MNWYSYFMNRILVVLLCATLPSSTYAQSAWQLYKSIYEDSPHKYESTDARDYDFASRLSSELIRELLDQCETEIDYGNYERVTDMLHAIGVAGELAKLDYNKDEVVGLVESIESRARKCDLRSAMLLPGAYRMLARIDEGWSNEELRRRCQTEFWDVAGPIEAKGGKWGQEDARLAALGSISLLGRRAEVEIVERARRDYEISGQHEKAKLLQTIWDSSGRRAAEHARRAGYSKRIEPQLESEL